MDIREATRSYENWLSAQTAVVGRDLRKKKELMVADPFPFFRGTFYRWAQLWPEHCPEFTDAPAVRCAGRRIAVRRGTAHGADGRG